MNRLLKIARREYLAYVRTFGFWLSMCLMPLGFGITFAAPAMLARSAPAPHLAVIDLTGHGYTKDIADAVKPPPIRRGPAQPPAAVLVPSPIPPPKDASEAAIKVRPLLSERAQEQGQRLDAVAVVYPQGDQVLVDLWTRNIASGDLGRLVQDAVADRMREERLAAAGVSAPEIRRLDALEPKLATYSPKAVGGKVSFQDRLPAVAGFFLGILLWAMSMSGAGILLNSVIEEKSSRVLEVLLASASPTEIIGGKIVGVAGVTVTVLTVWLTLGAIGLSMASPGLAGQVLEVLTRRGLLLFFAIDLICGYLMYAALFAAIGAFCETTREAQTLLAPVMMLMSIPIVFMSQAFVRPDVPILGVLSWIPTFTPFLMPVRAAADPPLWQMLGTAALMIACAAGSVWLSVRAFKAGALASGRLGPKAFLAFFFGGGLKR